MSSEITTLESHTYTVATTVYEGPLDLLLQLIERAELDITKLALAQVTNQYLAHLRSLQERTADDVSAFLVIASRLLQIKSEALLPRPPDRDVGEEDPGESLATQLIIYKRFKEISNLLQERSALGLRTYLRLAPPPKVEGKIDLSGLGVVDLLKAAREAFALAEVKTPLGKVVTPPKITIRDKIKLITQIIRSKGRSTFGSLIKNVHSRLDIVVTFLAMLELVKRHRVNAHQEELFGEISLEASDEWDDSDDLEIEFGE